MLIPLMKGKALIKEYISRLFRIKNAEDEYLVVMSLHY